MSRIACSECHGQGVIWVFDADWDVFPCDATGCSGGYVDTAQLDAMTPLTLTAWAEEVLREFEEVRGAGALTISFNYIPRLAEQLAKLPRVLEAEAEADRENATYWHNACAAAEKENEVLVERERQDVEAMKAAMKELNGRYPDDTGKHLYRRLAAREREKKG